MSKSRLEAAFALAWRTMGPAGVACQREYQFCPGRKWAFDFAFPGKRLAVEIDGGQWTANGGRHARDTDRVKLNRATVLGWRVLHYSGEMLKAPQAVIDEVVEALEERADED